MKSCVFYSLGRGSNDNKKQLPRWKCSPTVKYFIHNHHRSLLWLKSGDTTCGPRSKGEDKEETDITKISHLLLERAQIPYNYLKACGAVVSCTDE